jgi:Tol biopolymer transport system component
VTRAVASTVASLSCLLLLFDSSASAQYFGRNKVQAHSLSFQVLPTSHFDVYYDPAERAAALLAARMAERWYGRLSKVLQHTLSVRPPIVLYASRAQFAETTVIPDLLPEGVGGFTDHDRGRVVLPFGASLGETDHVLGHELVHAFQRDILRGAGRSMTLLPLWFSEGMAEYVSVGGIDANTRMWLRDAVHHDHLPTLKQLDDPKWFAYRYGQALWAYLSGRFGEDLAARALASTAKGGAIGRLTSLTGVDADTLSRDWHASLRDLIQQEEEPLADLVESSIVIGAAGNGRMNVAPSLSPDGSQLVFLSERDGYSIDAFLADAATGTVRRKLVSTAVDSHFDSLQFIESAGTWDAEGRQFAIATLQRGRAVLTILDVSDGTVRRERTFSELDQIFSPSWSPQGRWLVFSALHGGTTDLYEYDLDRDSLRQLTNDAYADLQPAWSPDGRSIAFVTDRFTSSLDDLTFGEYRLALLEVSTGSLRPIRGLPRGKHIDPQWTSNDSLLFVADAFRTSNVYRLDLVSGELRQVTDAREGISGITALGPAISTSAGSRRLAFTEYRAGAYEIRVASLEREERIVEVSPEPQAVEQRLFDAAPAPELAAMDSRPYDRRLSLRALGQPYVSAGGGMVGGYFRAGMSMAFSDLLEDQQLLTAVQVGSSMNDFASQTAYINRQSRWNWGAVGGQLPFGIGSSRLVASGGGAPTITRETQLLRQIHRQLTGVASYPFSASKRIELAGGVHAISYDSQTATEVYAGDTGRLLDRSDRVISAGAAVTLVESAAALVYDSSLFGATAPVLGTRYRVEAAPTFGDLSLMTLAADYRRYVMPVRPFSLAFRVEHIGRYGHDASDPRLLPLVWTLRDLVRGYDPHDVLATTDLTVVNSELRVPLVGTFGRLSGSSLLPIDALAFVDAGRFNGRPAASSATTTTLLRSVGAGVRLNAGGFIFELDAVRTIDSSPRGWTFAVNFRPGF